MEMASALTFALRAAVALLLAQHTAAAAVIQQDNSPVCVSTSPACQAKCQGQDFFYICASGNGPMGTPYVICRCARTAPAVGGPQQVARLLLADWPGANACNQKTWANDCTTQLTASVNGSSVTLTPAVKSAFNEDCEAAEGLVIGPQGTQAAVVYPQYPIGLTTTNADGTVTFDFSQTAADDPNQNDWSRCILTYRVLEGSFLNPRAAAAAAAPQALAAAASPQATAASPQAAAASSQAGGTAAAASPRMAAAASSSGGSGMTARAQVAAVAGLAAAYFAVIY